MNPKLDIVIPYRKSLSDELIYALRSLKNFEHGKVYIIGDNPNLNNVIYIPYRQTTDIAENTLSILDMACSIDDISDDFVWMADDMYFMKKIQEIPVLHRGTYDEVLVNYRQRKFNFYVQRMIRTNHKLKELGIENPLCYEVHTPFVINKKRWQELNISRDFNKLSMYANLSNLGGTKTKDVKVRAKDWVPNGHFASSHEATFKKNTLGRKVRELFPERSLYEK